VTPGGTCGPDSSCQAGFACNPSTGQCEKVICTPGEEVGCDGDRIKRCNERGTAFTSESCGYGRTCTNDKCQVELSCTPGEAVCVDAGTVGRCLSDGKSYEVLKTCDVAAEFYCTQLAGQESPDCVGPCDRARAERSNFGCDFFAVDLYNGAYSGAATDQFAIVVSNVSPSRAARVKVFSVGDELLFEAEVPPLSVEKFLPERRQRSTTNLEPLAFLIQSDIPIVAYQFNPLNNVGVYSNDATILVPVSSLDKEYLVMTRGSSLKNLPGYFAVVAVEDNTTVQIIPSTTSSGTQPSPGSPPTVPGMAAGAAYTLDRVMNRYDVLQVLAVIDNNNINKPSDLTGTAIVADKPVMVFAGSAGAEVPAGAQYADHIEHVMFPISAWGRRYAIARAPRGHEPTLVRFLAFKDGTEVTLTPGPSGNPTDSITLAAREWKEVSSTIDFMVTSTEPILVGQFLAGQQLTGLLQQGGDPAFWLVPPVEQYRTNYVFLVPDGFLHNRLVLVSRSDAQEILVDGRRLPLDRFATIADLGDAMYKAFWLELLPGTHLVESVGDHPVGIVAYGYDEAVSYAYTGGLSLTQINIPQ